MINFNYMARKLFLVALATIAVCATAFAQGAKNVVPGSKAEKFYQVVPEHEFTVNGFFGASTLLYKVGAGYDWAQEGETGTPHWREYKADFVNFSKGPFHPTGFGGGGGFGYIWHFHPNVGLMTGLDVAYYSGGVRNICGAYAYDGGEKYYTDNPFYTGYLETITTGEATTGERITEKYVVGYGVLDYTEMQKYLALQIPIMFQFMAPMGQGNNHFYAAIGARIGFGVWNYYQGLGGMMFSSYGPGYEPYRETWTDMVQGPAPGYYPYEWDNWEGPGKKYPWWKGEYYAQDNNSPDYMYHEGEDPDHPFQPSGKWGAKLVNVMASAEIGFRWRLADGLGLYTGIYCDYGIPTINKKQNVAQITGYPKDNDQGDYEAHSIMNTQTATGTLVRNVEAETGDHTSPNPRPGMYYTKQYMNEPMPQTVRAHTLGAGLKLKLAFGKVLPVAPVVPVLPKPDTVTKIVYVRDTVQNTVVVRDTVQNTVVVRDTVTNTVVVRDTVTIIKEIPVEIQQTMRDLSNTLFEFNKFNLGEKARGYLDEIVDWLVANPKVNVEIGGHTDGIGSQEYNQKLSENRAKTVYNYFVEHGVNKNRLSYKGYGKSEPIADNSTDAGRQQNRRVELKIINN